MRSGPAIADEFHIQGVADSRGKIGSSVFCLLLFSLGYGIFRVLGDGHVDLFWALWLGFIGSVALLTLVSRNSVVTRNALVFTYSVLGVLTPWRRSILPRSDFLGIERTCLKADAHDKDYKGIYSHQIVLKSRQGRQWVLQVFPDSKEQNPTELLAAAARIADRLAIPVSHRVESW